MITNISDNMEESCFSMALNPNARLFELVESDNESSDGESGNESSITEFPALSTLMGLSDEILIRILLLLDIANVSHASLVNIAFERLLRDGQYWKEKFRIHFPHLLKKAEKKNKAGAHWRDLFKEAYLDEYKGLSSAEAHLFSLTKEGNVPALRKIGLSISHLLKIDINKKSILDWANQKGHRQIQNYFWEVVQNHQQLRANQNFADHAYTLNAHPDWPLSFWAVKCHISHDEFVKLVPTGDLGQLGSIFIIAAKNGRLDLLEYLLSHNPLLLHVSWGRDTALHCASSSGQDVVVVALLKAGANTISHNSSGMLAIHCAAAQGHREVIRAFLQNTDRLAALNSVDIDGNAPLHIAVDNKQYKLVSELLREPGILLNHANNAGVTPAWLAINNDDDKMLTMLSNIEDYLNMQIDGESFLHYALRHARKNIALALINASQDKIAYVNQRNARDEMPFYIAALNAYNGLPILRQLIEAGADTTTPVNGMQPIHYLAAHERTDAIVLLLEKNPNLINLVDDNGMTPIMHAVKNSNSCSAFTLLDYDNLNLFGVTRGFDNPRENNKTVLHFAVESEFGHIFRTLLLRGAYTGDGVPIAKSSLTGWGTPKRYLRAEFSLYKYPLDKQHKPPYKHSFKLFGRQFNFGLNRDRQIAAARALIDVHNGGDKAVLEEYKAELHRGKLGRIYRRLR